MIFPADVGAVVEQIYLVNSPGPKRIVASPVSCSLGESEGERFFKAKNCSLPIIENVLALVTINIPS